MKKTYITPQTFSIEINKPICLATSDTRANGNEALSEDITFSEEDDDYSSRD